MAKEILWFERKLDFGKPKEMLPYYLERLEGTISRIKTKVNGVADSLLSAQHNGKWSVKQNIGHLAEVDEIANRRIDEIISGVSPMSPAVFEPKLNYNEMSITDVIQFFTERRKSNLKKYAELLDEDLMKSSLHPRLKVMMTAVDLAWFDAEHDDHHLVKINFILNQFK